MAKTQDLKPDTILKNYWNDNEQFADFFNAVLFEGRQVIKPDDLEDMDTEESSVLEHRDYAESIKASRDNIKICKRSNDYGVNLVMLGMESQEHIHYAMPLRVMGYDYGVYKKQYDQNARKYKTSDGMEQDEYLSRMKKADKFTPVITVVVYYGQKPWDGAASLHGMLDIPDEMKQFINDYKMILVEAKQNSLTSHNTSNIDFFSLLKIALDISISKSEAKERLVKYAEKHNVDRSVIMTVAGAANLKLDYNALSKKGVFDMGSLFEEIAKENKAEGRAEGKAEGKTEGRAEGIIETGFEFGLSEKDILTRLQDKLDISLKQAQAYLNQFGKQTV